MDSSNIQILSQKIAAYINDNKEELSFLLNEDFIVDRLCLEEMCTEQLCEDSFEFIENILWSKYVYKIICLFRFNSLSLEFKPNYVEFLHSEIALYNKFLRKMWKCSNPLPIYRIFIVLGDIFRYLSEVGNASCMPELYYLRSIDLIPEKYSAYNKLSIMFCDAPVEGIFFYLMSALLDKNNVSPASIFRRKTKSDLFKSISSLLSPNHPPNSEFLSSIEKTVIDLVNSMTPKSFDNIGFEVTKSDMTVMILFIILKFCETETSRISVFSLISAVVRNVLEKVSTPHSTILTFHLLLNDFVDKKLLDSNILQKFPLLFSTLFRFLNSPPELSTFPYHRFVDAIMRQNVTILEDRICSFSQIVSSATLLVGKLNNSFFVKKSGQFVFEGFHDSPVEHLKIRSSSTRTICINIPATSPLNGPVFPSLVVLSFNVALRWHEFAKTLLKYDFDVVVPFPILSIMDCMKKSDKKVRTALNKLLHSDLRIEQMPSRGGNEDYKFADRNCLVVEFVQEFVQQEGMFSDDLWLLKDRGDDIPHSIDVPSGKSVRSVNVSYFL